MEAADRTQEYKISAWTTDKGRTRKLTRTHTGVRYTVFAAGTCRSGLSNKADVMTGPSAVMRCPLLASEIWGGEGSFLQGTNAVSWDIPDVRARNVERKLLS